MLTIIFKRESPSGSKLNAEGTRDAAATYSKAYCKLQDDIKDFTCEFEVFAVPESKIRVDTIKKLDNLQDDITRQVATVARHYRQLTITGFISLPSCQRMVSEFRFYTVSIQIILPSLRYLRALAE